MREENSRIRLAITMAFGKPLSASLEFLMPAVWPIGKEFSEPKRVSALSCQLVNSIGLLGKQLMAKR